MPRRPPNAETRLARVLRQHKTTPAKPSTVVVAPDTDPAMLREILERAQPAEEERKLLIGRSIPLDPVIVPAQDATLEDAAEVDELDDGSHHPRSKKGPVKKGQG
ncbi:MAG: hypothetical protein IT384_02895 [Deltaproteobacteria bacterium]|nr:hypothetical protein [Deltaproteobacteria bacterium]